MSNTVRYDPIIAHSKLTSSQLSLPKT